MSYSQFGYSYPTSSQILVSGQHPMSVSPCCPASGPGASAEVPGAGGGETRLLSPFPRLAPGGFGIYGYAEHPLSTLAGTATSAFYPSLPSPYDLKESRSSWSALQPSSAPACYPYDPSGLASCGPYADRYSTIDSVARRKNATRETTNTLKAWLYEHRKNPYPTKGEKIMLAIITKMTLTQVSTWFANARRRLKKENKMTWEPRNKTSEGDDRDSSSPRDKSDDNNTEDDSNMTSPGVSGIDFLKQESDGYVGKHAFSEFEDHAMEPKSLNPPGKNCVSPYAGLGCFSRAAQSSEDSGTSGGSPSPARPLQVPSCYGDAQRFESGGKGDDPKEVVFCETPQSSFGPRPKIWSLARTATSNSPPLIRRYPPCPADYCLDKEDGGDCAKMKTGYSCSVLPYPDYHRDRTSASAAAVAEGATAEDLCCDGRPVAYGSVLPSCGVPAKCEQSSADCLGTLPPPSSERNSCMVQQCSSYAADYHPTNGAEHYATAAATYGGEKPFKDKDLCGAIEYATAKCGQTLLDGQAPAKKLTMPYPGSEPGAGTDGYYAAPGFEQTTRSMGAPLHGKGAASGGMEMSDPVSLLRRNDH